MALGTAGGEHAQVLAAAQALKRLGGIARRDEHLDELLVHVGEMLDERKRHLAVHGDNATEGALGVARKRAIVCGRHVSGNSGAAGILVLQDHHSGLVELAHRVPCRISVEEVVVRELLALDLLSAHQRIGRAAELLEVAPKAEDRCRLVRVLAIAQILHLGELHAEHARDIERIIRVDGLVLQLKIGVEPHGDGGVVRSRTRVNLRCKATARVLGGRATMDVHLLEDGIIICRIAYHGHGIVVLRGRAKHAGTADIDVLDGIFEGHVGLGDGLLELVQVHADKVDHLDAVLFRLGHMLLGIATREQAAVNLGVQRLDAPVHHLGEPGELLDWRNGDARLLENLCRASRRDNLDAEVLDERMRKLDDARFIGHRDERTLDPAF